MANIESLTFDQSGWQPIERTPYVHSWGDDIKNLRSVLSLEFFDAPPEIPVPLSDVKGLRFVYRTIANQSGAGLVSAEIDEVAGIGLIKTIFKLQQPNRGMVYVGSITAPFRDFSYVAKIQSVELGMAGIREAKVMDEFLAKNNPQKIDGEVEGWAADPYDPDTKYPFMPNVAEQQEYDKEFPDHALSKVRRTMKVIESTLRFDPELLESAKFTGEPEG